LFDSERLDGGFFDDRPASVRVGARRMHGKKAGHNRGKDESECFN
jgi:hypothetical protein